MKLLVIDGNSIINRAFYGIKLLTTKDGRFTNGIYGFLNILLKLKEQCQPDAVAVAFDLKEPTFRHKMYDGYKAGRKGMPPELASQMPVLKELLKELGYKTVECAGYEADDILGTLSRSGKEGDFCYIATGDRDSLQLVSDNVNVLLASTKMGRAETNLYDKAKLKEEYGVEPEGMIEIKALMGDSSDNIPGVAGIGKKTAEDLVQRFGNIDYIYDHLDEIDIKKGVREKLSVGKDSAYMSRTLGTISCEAPVEKNWNEYLIEEPTAKAGALLASLELFSIIKKIGVEVSVQEKAVQEKKQETLKYEKSFSADEAFEDAEKTGEIYFTFDFDESGFKDFTFISGEKIYKLSPLDLSFNSFILKICESESIKKYTTDIKNFASLCSDLGGELKREFFDTSLAGYLLNPSASDYDIVRLSGEYSVSPCEISDEEDVPDSVKKILHLKPLCGALKAKLNENCQEELMEKIELPLALVLSDMEKTGFMVDGEGLKKFGISLEGRIGDIVARIYSQAGFEFNINSPKQLGEALFVKMGIPAKKKTKSGYSTSADVLEGLAADYPIVADVLEYRTLAKLKSTYCDGLAKAIGDDGRIHSTLNQTETRTGRISSAEPNLQNIPVRQELGRELRKFFRAKDGCVLVDADYSQIELRVLAHMADDENMIEAFNNGDDIHAITASQVFNMPLNMVTPLMRSRAKAVNFGIVYGIGAFSLGKDIGVSRAEADRYIKGYLNHYSGVAKYMEDAIKTAKELGYSQTLFGRRRYLPEITASNGMLRAFGERVARNMPIQGTAADIIKIAMIKVSRRLKEENMESKLIMQVHDELIVEAPENEAEKAAKIVKEEMENACKMKVKLLADVNIGKTWYDAKG